jgi:predicted O-methyltransferase YrrM
MARRDRRLSRIVRHPRAAVHAIGRRPRRLVQIARAVPSALRQSGGAYPPGHYYSPVPDIRDLKRESARIWPSVPNESPGIEWRDDGQLELCTTVFARQERMRLAPGPSSDPHKYVMAPEQNWFFWPLDAWILEAMLRHLRPRRMIEIGSGFSSLMTARVNRECLDSGMRFTTIDPFPSDFLVDGVPGIAELRTERVQDTPPALFNSLDEGDVLFIDTSHTVKTGGDVPWIFNRVVPRLNPGVVVQIHDIFLPHDYPRDWVLGGWGWNELYLVEAFLSFNAAFEMVFSADWMLHYHREEMLAAFPGYRAYADAAPTTAGMSPESSRSSGSLWIRRVPAAG